MTARKHYVIKFKESEKRTKYIRSCVIIGDELLRFATLTPKRYLVDNSYIFKSREDAESFIEGIVNYSKQNLKRAKGRIKKYYNNNDCNRYWRNCYGYDVRRGERFSDKSNYTIEEFIPDFYCDKKRKTVKTSWKKDGSSKTFCVCCGNNLFHGKYVVIRQAKICPFCLKRMGEQAQGVIDKLKEKEPEIEDNYNISIFVEHMD